MDYAHIELKNIQTLISAENAVTFYGSKATRDALWEALPQANIVHFSCHGHFDAKYPLKSALLLARDTRLTLRDLFNADRERLARLQLAVLSACQTAVSDIQQLPNEVIGMLTGFLRAGVPTVVGTLWSVNDISTTLLMVRFYDLYLHGDTQQDLLPLQPLAALRLAQRWLRDLSNDALLVYLREQTSLGRSDLATQLGPRVRSAINAGNSEIRPYAHPYYWAGFVYYGA